MYQKASFQYSEAVLDFINHYDVQLNTEKHNRKMASRGYGFYCCKICWLESECEVTDSHK